MLNQSDHYEPGTALISLFGTKGYRILPVGIFSTHPSYFHGGETVYVRKDDGVDRLLIERRGETYDTHRGDWAPLPDAHTVAWLLVNNSINESQIERLKAERDALKAGLAEALAQQAQVIRERDAANACIASLHRRAVAATEALGVVYAPEGYVDSPDAE